MTLEESREVIPMMESMINQIEEQQNLMAEIGNGSTAMFVLGVIVGIIGLLGMGVNYPIYKKLLAQGKQKYAFEIMELAKEISEK